MLWRVVEACVADYALTGASFPCLDVKLVPDRERGYVVVRAPFEASHIIVAPSARVVGIEAPALRRADAPNYFADAWNARRFVAQGLSRAPGRDDLAMAVNSRPGRSQDQLHIHVDCVRPDVRVALDRQLGRLARGAWSDVALAPRMPRYGITWLDEDEFRAANIVALTQTALAIPADELEGMTVAVVPASLRGVNGFAVLARRRVAHSRDSAHSEALLDHTCAILR